VKGSGAEQLTSGEWGGMLLAAVVAAVTGYAAIAFLLGWLRKRSLGVFAVYRVVVGAFCIGLFFLQQPHREAVLPEPPAGIGASVPVSQPQPPAPAGERL
jgi:drug/metabolite transporter (DMT)-like permease